MLHSTVSNSRESPFHAVQNFYHPKFGGDIKDRPLCGAKSAHFSGTVGKPIAGPVLARCHSTLSTASTTETGSQRLNALWGCFTVESKGGWFRTRSVPSIGPPRRSVRRKRPPPPWTTLHLWQPARSPLINQGKLFKQTGLLLRYILCRLLPFRMEACATNNGGKVNIKISTTTYTVDNIGNAHQLIIFSTTCTVGHRVHAP